MNAISAGLLVAMQVAWNGLSLVRRSAYFSVGVDTQLCARATTVRHAMLASLLTAKTYPLTLAVLPSFPGAACGVIQLQVTVMRLIRVINRLSASATMDEGTQRWLQNRPTVVMLATRCVEACGFRWRCLQYWMAGEEPEQETECRGEAKGGLSCPISTTRQSR